MASPARHTRAVHREHGETESDLGALELGRPEHWVLVQVRRRGVAGFVVQMTCFAVVASMALVTAMMLVLYGADDPTLVPSMIMAAIVPAVVAPPVLVFTVRLAAALDRASRLLWDAAHTDPLTDVANRRAFFEAVGRSDGPLGQPFDVAIVDLDAFKVINDRHGHAGGDLAARWRRQAAVTPEYQAPFPFTGGSIDKVVVDVSGEGYLNHEQKVAAWFGID